MEGGGEVTFNSEFGMPQPGIRACWQHTPESGLRIPEVGEGEANLPPPACSALFPHEQGITFGAASAVSTAATGTTWAEAEPRKALSHELVAVTARVQLIRGHAGSHL